jgi:hypothetical protein
MILDRFKTGLCRLIWPSVACEPSREIEDRLDRAERLHVISKKAAATEKISVQRRVGDMRIVANSAVKRLRHDRGEIEEVET